MYSASTGRQRQADRAKAVYRTDIECPDVIVHRSGDENQRRPLSPSARPAWEGRAGSRPNRNATSPSNILRPSIGKARFVRYIQTFGSTKLLAFDRDRADWSDPIADFKAPPPLQFERVLDVARQPFGGYPSRVIIGQFLTDIVFVRGTVRDLKKVPRHCFARLRKSKLIYVAFVP
jgi:hypothetical protein